MKTTKLPSVEEVVEKVYWEDQWDGSADEVQELLTQDRNQAYTSLVAGIDGMEAPEFSEYDLEALHEGFFLALSHILENVVKPLYNKTGDNLTTNKTPRGV